MTTEGFDPFAGPQIQLTAPSTEPQREIWAAVQMGSDASCAFNESNRLRFKGPLDAAALRASVTDLVQRHEALRTTFSADGASMVVLESMAFEVPLEDASAAGVEAALVREVTEPFDLQRGPLFRARLLRLAPAEHVLVFTSHHIVCDGWSTAILLKDLAALYAARARGSAAQLPAASRYSDYARALEAWTKSPECEAARGYWQKQFATIPPAQDLPSDRPRPPLKSYRSERADCVLPAPLIQDVKKMAAKSGCSFFTALLAGFDVLAGRLSGLDDVAIGIPAAGQPTLGLDGVVGHCVNTVALRNTVSADARFVDFMKAVRKTMLDGLQHQQLTFGSLLRELPLPRDPSRLPLVSVLFNVDQAPGAELLRYEGLEVEFAANPRRFENFDLFVNAVESKGAVTLECQFNADLFDRATIVRWMAAYETLLGAAVAQPESAVSQLPLVPESERARMAGWNATAKPYAKELGVHQLVEAQVGRTPDAVALTFEAEKVTYRQLDARANAYARALAGQGVKRGSLVGISLPRSTDMVAAMLGVLKAGAAYVPLDPAFPKERLAFMAEDAGLKVTIDPNFTLPADVKTVPPELSGTTATISGVVMPLNVPASGDDVAYVIYTSGSTGKPKGVQVPHRAVVNFLQAAAVEPGLSAQDTLLAVTTLSFDIAVLELLLPLTVGARVVIASKERAADGALLLDAIQREGVTAMQATPSTWRLLLAAGWKGSPTFKVICGGEALPVDLAQSLSAASASAWNMYGPTETTVWSTCYRLPKPFAGPVLIGKPLANQQVHILDEKLQPLPVGVPGELYIGGDGVTLGYLHRPELTKERFRDGLYRTGDVARFRPDGNVEYLRRNDNQVKLRGFRIELGEVEAALASHPAVAQAVALVREDKPGDVRLVGYTVHKPGQGATATELRKQLRLTLPEYMLPQHFIELDAFPLTPNGKIDRKKLPAPSGEVAAGPFVPPSTKTEEQVASSFQAILGIQRISIDDDFFTLGGHSLLAAQLVSRLDRECSVQLSLRRLFEAPTVRKLAALVDAERGKAAKPAARIAHRSQQAEAPVSLMQQRLWFLEQLNPDSPLFNLPAAFRLIGRLDVPTFEQSLNALALRHPAMRTTFRWQGDAPIQVVAPQASAKHGIQTSTVATTPAKGVIAALDSETGSATPENGASDAKTPLRIIDLRDRSGAEREKELMARLNEATNTPFHLTQGPLVRAQLYRTTEEEHVFFFMPHHAVWDGWSFDIFLRDLCEEYDARVHGRPARHPELPISYADFSVWHREWLQGEELARQSAYWRGQLAGELPILELPADRPRPPALTYQGGTVEIDLSKEEVDALTASARQMDGTLYMLMLAAFEILLYRYSGQTDLIVGTPIRGRTLPETEDVIGFFVNTLALRTRLDPDATGRDFMAKIRASCLGAFANPDMPFELLVQELGVQRDMSRTPIFQTFFSFQDATNRGGQMGGVDLKQVHLHCAASPVDLNLWVKVSPKGLGGGLNYATDLFDAATVERMLAQYKVLLGALAREPERKICELALLPESERARMAGWNATAKPYAKELGVHQLVEAQVRRTPDAVALTFEAEKVTYRQLDARANAYARALAGQGVKRGSLVGISLPRSTDMVAAMLGVLKAGAAYVPLDPAFPKERLAFMAEDAGLKVTIDSGFALPPGEGGVPGSASGDDVAYVIYTSGSTGKPKGVQVPHRAVVNFLQAAAVEPGLSAQDTLLAVTTLSFDIAVLELLLPLTVGARVVIASKERAADGVLLLDAIQREGVTAMQATPSTWRLLLAAGWKGSPTFKVICGGEALPVDLAQSLSAASASAWNMYGPTETTVWSTCYPLPKPFAGPVLIGKPLANQQVHILDEKLQPLPVGVPGELYIGGDGVTLGYLHRPELTKERFRDGLYRTGDVARFRPDGNVEYLRRNDNQVKLRGFRIELGEVEAALASHPAVAQAVALVREDKPGDVRLVGYTVHKPGQGATATELRKQLRLTLPEYMLPQHFIELDAFPLTPNGKIDRKRLPAPAEVGRAAPNEFVAPRTPAEVLLAGIWQETLRVQRVSARDNFFDLGGHSLLCLTALARVEEKTGKRLSPRVVLLNTLEQIAAQLGPI